MPDQEPNELFDAITAKLQVDREAEAARFAEMFVTPATCTICGAHATIPSQHKAFHDGVNKAFAELADRIEKVARAAGVIRDA
ncbi:hypothetical protein ACFWWS_36885 [Streptomyces sp. NPDC059083]|uniref:hypothetical protein n=1 Tax=Streptomyces sp. NPDC059083 TaxID=3346721 RepID=UPI0036881C94